MSNETAAKTLAVDPVIGDNIVRYSIKAFERLGKINVEGCARLPDHRLVGDEDQMNLYNDKIDSGDRKKNRIWSESVKKGEGGGCRSSDTGTNWGSGFYVGYFAKDHQSGKFVLVAQAGPTEA